MKELSIQSPLAARFFAWTQERFPLLNYGILILSYYSSNQFLAHALDSECGKMSYSLRSLLGAVTVLCMFFHLRVFDEHKDYEDDCKYHPGRVLQRGLIRLYHLKIAGAIAIALELVIGLILGPQVLLSILIALAFSILMLKEFFVGEWLRKHFLIYATSHMLIMPLFAIVVYSIATNLYIWDAPGWFWVYSFVGFFVTFNWEVSRKIRAPGDEIDGVETYSSIFGPYGAAYIVLAIRVVDTLMVALVGHHLGLSPWFYAVLIALYIVCLTGFLQFRFNTNRKNAHRMEAYAGMYIIAFDLTLAIEIARKYGIEAN